MMRSFRLAPLGMVLLTTIGVGALASPAQAASTGVVSVVKTTQVQYKAGSGKTNKVVVTRSGRTVTVDDKVKIKAGKGCKAVKGDKTKVRCKLPKSPTRVLVYAGDKNDAVANKTGIASLLDGGTGTDKLYGGSGADVLSGRSGADKLYGGAGNDYLTAGSGNDKLYGQGGADDVQGNSGDDTVYGGSGNDSLHGDAESIHDKGNDKLYGESGNDRLAGWVGDDYLSGGAGDDALQGDLDGDNYNTSGNGADVLLGGTGVDTADYGTHGSVTVDLDGASRDDGMAGEHDTVGADVENITGGDGVNKLTGNAAANRLTGSESGDVLRGLGGDDYLNGTWGLDDLQGGDGDDTLIGVDTDPANELDADKVDGGANTAVGDLCKVSSIDVVTGCERLG